MPLAMSLKKIFKESGIDFVYERNELNLGVDIVPKIHKILGDGWGLVLHHDDWFVDQDFLTSCMSILENHPNENIQFFYANAITEKTKVKMLDSNDENWKFTPGEKFVSQMLSHGITSWGSILFNSRILKNAGWPNERFYIGSNVAKQLDLDSDDGFSGFYLLAMYGNCYTSSKVVCVRGEPESSYSKSSAWKNIGNSLFYIYFNLHNYIVPAPYAAAVRKQALASLYFWRFQNNEKINYKLIRHFASWKMLFHYFLAITVSKLALNRCVSIPLSHIATDDWKSARAHFSSEMGKMPQIVFKKLIKMCSRQKNAQIK